MTRPCTTLFSVALLALTTAAIAGPRTKPSTVALPDSSTREVTFNNITLADALDALAEGSNANMVVNWKALEAIGVSKETPVTIKVKGLGFFRVLDLVLSQAAEDDKLTYEIEGNVLLITSRESADKKLVTRVYGIEDFLYEPRDFYQAPAVLSSTLGGGSGQSGGRSGGRSGGSNSGGFGGGSGGFGQGNGGNIDPNNTANAPSAKADALIKQIKATVRPDIWDDNGGPGRIKYYRGNLIVTAPKSVQRLIGG